MLKENQDGQQVAHPTATLKDLWWKWSILGIVFLIAAAIITPPDIVSQLVVAAEMAIVYGVVILIVRRSESFKKAPETKKRAIVIGVCLFSVLAGCCRMFVTRRLTHAEIAGEPDLKAGADELKRTIVTPHLEQEIEPGTNVLWCNTFQLAWNEFYDLAGGPIAMESAPPAVDILNKRTASKEDLDEASYVAVAGLAEEGVYERIREQLQEKFAGQASTDLLDSVPQIGWVAYANLFKQLPFRWAFTRFHGNLKFEGFLVDSFGIAQLSETARDESRMAEQVAVLDHRDNDDLIIELKTQAPEDRLILAKIPPQATLAEMISVVEQRIDEARPKKMAESEYLYVPVLNLDVLRLYSELCGHPFSTANKKLDGTSMALAAQSIRFRLDERGAVLKSESIFWAGLTPRNLVFDKPFLILLKRRGANNPYFALWVGNADLLVPAHKKPADK